MCIRDSSYCNTWQDRTSGSYKTIISNYYFSIPKHFTISRFFSKHPCRTIMCNKCTIKWNLRMITYLDQPRFTSPFWWSIQSALSSKRNSYFLSILYWINFLQIQVISPNKQIKKITAYHKYFPLPTKCFNLLCTLCVPSYFSKSK